MVAPHSVGLSQYKCVRVYVGVRGVCALVHIRPITVLPAVGRRPAPRVRLFSPQCVVRKVPEQSSAKSGTFFSNETALWAQSAITRSKCLFSKTRLKCHFISFESKEYICFHCIKFLNQMSHQLSIGGGWKRAAEDGMNM